MGDHEEEDQENDDLHLHEGIEKIHNLIHDAEVLESPIDIHIPKSMPLDLPKLEWHHMDLDPKRVKLTNSGHTIIYSAKWHQERPYISGGPFIGNYVFSQMHFHWGSNNMSGSEHTISGVPQILEMHIVFFKSCYLTQESALKRKDGIAVAVVMFKLQDEQNFGIMPITDTIPQILDPYTSAKLKNFCLNRYITPFTDDYFLYLGTVNAQTCTHYVLWLISRNTMGISKDQIEAFRTLIGTGGVLLQNCRDVQPFGGRLLYHVNPSSHINTTLLPNESTVTKKHQTMSPKSSID